MQVINDQGVMMRPLPGQMQMPMPMIVRQMGVIVGKRHRVSGGPQAQSGGQTCTTDQGQGQGRNA